MKDLINEANPTLSRILLFQRLYSFLTYFRSTLRLFIAQHKKPSTAIVLKTDFIGCFYALDNRAGIKARDFLERQIFHFYTHR